MSRAARSALTSVPVPARWQAISTSIGTRSATPIASATIASLTPECGRAK